MTETLERVFAPTHNINGVPVMRNPDWKPGPGGGGWNNMWVDDNFVPQKSGRGNKAEPYAPLSLPAVTKIAAGGEFGTTFGAVGEVVPAEWWLADYANNSSQLGVMVTREAAAAALRACAWPDSSAPCGQAGNSNDDDASFEGYDRDGNCVVRLFMRGKGYFKVKIPRALFLEIAE